LEEEWLGVDEIDKILERTYGANRKGEDTRKRKRIVPATTHYSAPKVNKVRDKYLLVDGYNVIFAWDELNELSKSTLEGARGKLMDLLCNYQALTKVNLILVFDAYRVLGHKTEILDYHNIHVVYTKEAETADQYIEKFAHNHSEKYDITVATSDGLEQVIIRGQGCRLLSAREFKKDFEERMQQLRDDYLATDKSKD
jgi:predicted RNA-binding protein with PIN domain